MKSHTSPFSPAYSTQCGGFGMLHSPGDTAFHHAVNGPAAVPGREREARACAYLRAPNTTHLPRKGSGTGNRS